MYSAKKFFKTVFFHERWQNCWSRAKDKEGAIAVTNKYYALALNSNQKLTLKPKQNDTYHLDLDTVTPDTAVPPQWLQTVSRWRAEERGDAGGEAGHLQGGQEAAQGEAEDHRHGQTLR